MSMLKVEHIDVYYGAIHAIKDISFEVNEGEIVTLIGANGAGKSTTLKTVSAMMRPKNGTIEFLGHNMTNLHRTRLCRWEWHIVLRAAGFFSR